VLKASAEVPAAKVAEVPPGYYAPLAREVTESAIKAAIEISKPAVTGVADEPMVKAAAPPAKPVAAPPAKLVAALPAKPAEAAAPSLAKWQEKEAAAAGPEVPGHLLIPATIRGGHLSSAHIFREALS